MLYAKGAKEFARAPLGMCRRDTVRVNRGQTDIRDRREMFEQAVELEHHAYFSPQLLERARRDRSAAFERDAVDGDASAVESFEPCHGSEDRCLSRARRTHDRDELAAPNSEGHARQNGPRAAAQVQVVDVEDRFGHA